MTQDSASHERKNRAMTVSAEHHTGSMGSDIWTLRLPSEHVSVMAKFDWNAVGRKILIDVKEGLISWMSPSWLHESISLSAGETVRQAARLMKIGFSIGLGARTWKVPGTSPKGAVEADSCFYIGQKADAWNQAKRMDTQRIRKFLEDNPPDLVIETEITHADRTKAQHWADIGAEELWNIEASEDSIDPAVTLIDLKHPDGPVISGKSRLFPGLDSINLAKTVSLINKGYFREAQILLEERLEPRTNLTARPSETDEEDTFEP